MEKPRETKKKKRRTTAKKAIGIPPGKPRTSLRIYSITHGFSQLHITFSDNALIEESCPNVVLKNKKAFKSFR
jgi:hypothetical protein